ncbi:MAG: hypothetical protein ACIALR_11515 [Blastopirellula sp. JB062]
MSASFAASPPSAQSERREPSQALQALQRELWKLDDDLRSLCIEHLRQTLRDEDASSRDKQNALSVVLKLSEFNVENAMRIAEIDGIENKTEEDGKKIAVVTNENFYGNRAHETNDAAVERSAEPTHETTDHRSAGPVAPSTADPVRRPPA